MSNNSVMDLVVTYIVVPLSIIMVVYTIVSSINAFRSTNDYFDNKYSRLDNEGYSEGWCKEYYSNSRVQNVPVGCLKYFK